jgi:hypothetical protein
MTNAHDTADTFAALCAEAAGLSCVRVVDGEITLSDGSGDCAGDIVLRIDDGEITLSEGGVRVPFYGGSLTKPTPTPSPREKL